MAIVSYGTITITDTNDIERIYTVYAKSTTNTTAPSAAASSWTESISTAPGSGDYIWQRTVVEKSGTGELTYGDPVCVTGPEGDPGATGKGVKSLVTQYYLSTSSSSVAGGSWSAAPQSYPTTGTKYYWTKTITTYTDNTTYESTAVYDVALTSSVKDARDANVTADEAKGIAQQASIDITNLQTRTKYFWTNLTAHTNGTSGWTKPDYPVGTFAASGISGTTFDYENSSTYGYNTLYSNGIKLRYNAINLGELTGTALTFYHPSTASQGAKAMELSATALKFYDATGSVAQAEFGGTQAKISGTINAYDGKIGNNNTNYWYIGNYTDYNQNDSAIIKSIGTASIQLNETNTWRVATNRIHTAWAPSTGTDAFKLHFPIFNDSESNSKHWDYGLHLPTSNTDKFLYIRNASSTQTLDNLLDDLEDSGYNYWTYQFYIDGEGNLHAGDIYSHGTLISGTSAPYLLKSGGTMTGSITMSNGGKLIGDVTGNVSGSASKLSNTSKIGDTNKPVYFTANGVPAVISYEINKTVPSDAIFTDKNVQTTKANTTKIYLTGTQTNGTSTGTLNFDEYVYVDTTAGALHATTFNGYTLAAAAAKGVDTSMTSTSTSTNLPTTKAVADLIATYLPLAGGTISGAVDINDELYADSATFGNLIVNGIGRFTNGIYGDLIGNVTGSITGNAATADKVNHNLVIKLASGTTEGTNMFTFNGSVAKTVDITKSALGLGNVENKSSATIRGELTSANVTTALGFTPYNSTNPNGYTSNVGTITGVTAGTGLSGGGTSGAVTLNHSNSVTAQTTQGIYPIKIDAQGHISAYDSAPTTLSGYGITDAKIANGVITLGSNTITPLTSQWTANLYVGKTATDKANAAATNGNVYLNLVENNTVRNAHKITGSGTTTVTSDADGNITISSADSKTGTVTSITLTQGTGISIGSSGTAITTSGSRTIGLADNYGDTKNPYASKTARYVLAAPADAAGAPSFRALTGADVGLGNVLNAAQVTGIGQGADGKIRVYKGDSNYEDVAVEIVATESSSVASAQKLTSYGGSTKQPVYFPNSGTNAGKPVAIGYTIETSVPSGAVFTDTTYTFANGTNGFTVTPLNGTAQTVTVTPSITNNITGSGTSGYLAKFNGANTITNGPALGTDTTKFLNNKGEWSVPTNTNTTYTLTNVLASHKFTWTFTAGGSGSGSTTTALELVQGSNITLTDDTTNKKVTIAAKDTTYSAGTGLSLTGTTFANAGVTGIKGNSESSYRTGQVNLTPANLGAVAKNDELLTTNPFRPSSMTGPYISKIDNAFYAANKRWNISMTNISGASTSSLFDGSYETNVTIEAGKTSILTMDFSPTTYFPGYPYGYILVSFYYTGIPVSVSGRVYCNYSASGVGWHDISFSPISDSTSTGTTYRSSHQDYYNISQLEITIVGASSPTTKVTQVEMHLDRPDSSRTPFVSKYSAETLYYNLTAPKFIGDLQGKADNATIATKTGDSTCILYPMANNEINFGGSAAKNTIYFGYRTTDNQAAPTKYVFSGSTGTASLQCNKVYLGSGTTAYIDGTTYTGNAATATTATTAGAFSSNASITLTGDTTGSASSTKGWSITTKTDRLSTVGDNRSVATIPNDYANKIIFQGIKYSTTIGISNVGTYSYLIGLRGWADNSGGNAHEIAFNDTNIFYRKGATTAWGDWHQVYTSASTIPVANGGTGTTTFAAGTALIGNGTNAIQTRSITNVTSGAVSASTNLVTANSLVAHVSNALGNYVTIAGDNETVTGTKVFNNLLGTKYVATKGGNGCEINYNSSLEALVFSFS